MNCLDSLINEQQQSKASKKFVGAKKLLEQKIFLLRVGFFNMSETAPCGCFSSEECAICFEMICCGGTTVQDVCYTCIHKLSETASERPILHPVRRTPLDMCQCGKIWNAECAQKTLFSGRSFIIDPVKLAACKTPQERFVLLNDPSSRVAIQDEHHGFIKA